MRFSWLPAVLAGLFLGATLWGAVAVQAQTATAPVKASGKAGKAKPGAKHDGNAMLKKLLAQLNLTPDQMTKLKAIEAKNKQTTSGIQANKTLSVDQKKTLIRAEGKNVRKEVEMILTPAQREKMKALMLQMAMDRKNKMAAKGGAPVAGTPSTPHAIK